MPRTLSLLLPALIPSWRFFKTVAPSPRVEYRLDGGDWTECRHRPDSVSLGRMLRRMLWNPRWNEQLFLVSLSERLVAEPTQHSLDELNKRIARLSGAQPGARLQFRLVFVCREGAQIVKFVEYESTPIVVGPS
ncbi:hypothetical protein [Tropicibacter oceani]|uniref:Uncharacterized protein n=1 Tax=Tropicibacter oceani TaxID=3058420 RepID=A0ABY8QII1_9RHOB|nr:hypothetical protein [Tropicibacter oceani]WGW04445.1 hypothetical protein QF118_02550 [Tropicibacter oceani]